MVSATLRAPASVQIGDGNGRAGRSQPAGDRFADAGGRAGYDRRLPCKVEHGYSSLTTLTVISVVTSLCSRTVTLCSPSCLIGLVQQDLAAVDGEVLLFQRLGDVLGRDRTEELIVLAGLLRDRDA